MVDMSASDGERVGGYQAQQQPDLLAALRRQWMTIVVAALLGTVVAWAFAESRPTVFEARSTLLLVAAGDEQAPGGGRDRTLDIATWATVARETVLLQSVADELGLELADVRARSTVTPAPTGDTLVITFEAGSVDAAIDGARVYSEEFLAQRNRSVNQSTLDQQQRLEDLATGLERQIAEISDLIDEEESRGDDASTVQLSLLTATQQQAIERLAQVNTQIATLDTDADTGRVLVDPRTAASQTGLSRSLTTLAGLMIGGLFGLIAALLRDRYDDRYSSASTVASLGVREIARVPYRRLAGPNRPHADQAYSRLIARLTFSRRDSAELGRAVLLLPVDSRSLPDDIAVSVASSLSASADLTGILIDVSTDSADLEARPGHWAETLDDVQSVREHNDLVLLPVPALDRSAAGIGMAALVDDTILLVAEGTPMRSVRSAIDDLRAVDAANLQLVLVTGVARRRAPERDHHTDDAAS